MCRSSMLANRGGAARFTLIGPLAGNHGSNSFDDLAANCLALTVIFATA